MKNFYQLPSNQLREQFLGSSTSETQDIALKNIMLVGSTKSFSDMSFMDKALSLITKAGIPIDDKSIIKHVDIHDGRDFLTIDEPADIVITCFVDNLKITPKGGPCMKSPLHHEDGIWQESALRVGAKVIFTKTVDDEEIGAQQFRGDNFKELDPTSINNCNILIKRNYMDALYKRNIIDSNSEIGLQIHPSSETNPQNNI